jgi:signal transduction histidine kinase
VAADGYVQREGAVSATAQRHSISRRPGLTPVLMLCAAGLLGRRLRLRRSVAELEQENERVASAVAGERRRIERDLHDGAQQRLVALQIKLALLREELESQAPESAAAVRRLEAEAEAATEELRALAHGIHPPPLTEHGLGGALAAAARRSGLAATVRVDGVGRWDAEIERAVYFACVEALQNAAKHARGASEVEISLGLDRDGALRFEVRDDGPGFVNGGSAGGAGLANLRERLAAVGGELRVVSPPDGGTCVAGVVPPR